MIRGLEPDGFRAYLGVMSDDAADPRPLPPAARRALEEAALRRAAAAAASTPPGGQTPEGTLREHGGPAGAEPTRYGDWERKGIAVDF